MLMRFILLEKTSVWFFKISIFGAPVEIADFCNAAQPVDIAEPEQR